MLVILYGIHHTLQKLEESYKQIDQNNKLSNENSVLKISTDKEFCYIENNFQKSMIIQLWSTRSSTEQYFYSHSLHV